MPPQEMLTIPLLYTQTAFATVFLTLARKWLRNTWARTMSWVRLTTGLTPEICDLTPDASAFNAL